MVDKSKLAIATSQIQNPIPFLIELLFNLLSQMITVSTIKLTSQPVRYLTHIRNFRHVVQKDTWIIITILSQQIKQINSIEHKKSVAWVFWANQGFLLAA